METKKPFQVQSFGNKDKHDNTEEREDTKCILQLTSGGVEGGFDDFRSAAGFEFTDRGDRSTEWRTFCKGDGDSDSDLDTPLLTLLPLGVASDALLGVSDKLDLSNS